MCASVGCSNQEIGGKTSCASGKSEGAEIARGRASGTVAVDAKIAVGAGSIAGGVHKIEGRQT